MNISIDSYDLYLILDGLDCLESHYSLSSETSSDILNLKSKLHDLFECVVQDQYNSLIIVKDVR